VTIAMLYAENGDIVATYDSLVEAIRDLAGFIKEHPEIEDEIGLRFYRDGKPMSPFLPASVIVGERQERLLIPEDHFV
jgi:hypothetical protein